MRLRIREKAGDRLTKVYRNTPLKTQGLTDKKAIVVELLDEEQLITPKEHLVICRRWDPSTADFLNRYEIVIDRNACIQKIAEKISEKEKEIKVTH